MRNSNMFDEPRIVDAITRAYHAEFRLSHQPCEVVHPDSLCWENCGHTVRHILIKDTDLDAFIRDMYNDPILLGEDD